MDSREETKTHPTVHAFLKQGIDHMELCRGSVTEPSRLSMTQTLVDFPDPM